MTESTRRKWDEGNRSLNLLLFEKQLGSRERALDSESSVAGMNAVFCYQLWAPSVALSCLRLLPCKMGLMLPPHSQGCCEDPMR